MTALPLPILAWENYVDTSVISASAEVSGMSGSNLAEPIVGRRLRMDSLTGFVDIDFGENKSVGLLLLRFPRDVTLPVTGMVTHALDADGGTPGAGADYSNAASLAVTAGYGYHAHVPASPVTARHWRFTFSSVTGVSFLDIGRAWASVAWSPTYGLSFGVEDEWVDLSRVSSSERSGAEFVDERPRQRAMAFGLDAMDDDERDDIRELQRIAGQSNQIVFIKDSGNASTETILGRLGASTPIRHTAAVPLHSKAFVIRESL